MRANDMTKEKQDFVPSKKILPRIMRVLLENNSINRTALAIAANLNYSVLSKYVIWLETKSFVEFTISYGKLAVKLTENGREFAVRLASLPY